jgi:hypothetical protein
MEAYIFHWFDKQPTQYPYGLSIIFGSHRSPQVQHAPYLRCTHVAKEATNPHDYETINHSPKEGNERLPK